MRRRNPESLYLTEREQGEHFSSIDQRYSQEDKDRFRDYIKTRAMRWGGPNVDEEKLDDRIEDELLWRLERNYDITGKDDLRHAYDDVTAYHEDIFYPSGPRSWIRRPVRDRSERNPVALAINERNRGINPRNKTMRRRRRRNPEALLEGLPIISKLDDNEIRIILTYGVLSSGESEYAREKILLPMIDDLRKVYADLEAAVTSEMLDSHSLSPVDAELQAEHQLVKILIIMLGRLNQRIDNDSLGPGRVDY